MKEMEEESKAKSSEYKANQVLRLNPNLYPNLKANPNSIPNLTLPLSLTLTNPNPNPNPDRNARSE